LRVGRGAAYPAPSSNPRAASVKLSRHAAILELVRNRRVSSQEVLRELLVERGIDVAQATLSRDIRDLGLVKAPDEQGGSVYVVPAGGAEHAPTLQRLLPALYLGADGVGNLLVLKTLAGGAQPIAAALDAEGWDEIVGTIGGDDTILLVLRAAEQREAIVARIEAIADRRPE
jgi:transcriptional regulator of arginine metabolism